MLEAYTPEQRDLKSDGPPDAEMLMTFEDLQEELAGLEFKVACEVRREIHEGKRHNGIGSVVQVLGSRALEGPGA